MRVSTGGLVGTPALLLLVVGLGNGAGQVDRQALIIAPDASQVTVRVGKAGLFGFAGHAHEVVTQGIAGTVTLDVDHPTNSSLSLEIDAASLRVTGTGEPATDVAEVQRVMLSARVLDVKRFPSITFQSKAVDLVDRTDEALVLNITGTLTLRGVVRPLHVRTTVEYVADDLVGRGSLRVKQTDFGIEPVGAAGGLVTTRNELTVEFVIVARPPAADGPAAHDALSPPTHQP